MTIERQGFGRLPDGREVELVTLANAMGMEARIITYGATIQALTAPDRDGRMADVALGFGSLEAYVADTAYFGASVGRVANRIAKGRFTLDGNIYRTPVNNGDNALHGGSEGFDKKLWSIARQGPGARVTMEMVSPHCDQGYPGTLTVSACFELTEDGTLSIDYRAVTDRPTIVNLTNHAYWNLAGEGAPEGAMGHRLTIPAEHFLPTDAGSIPTGEFRPVAGTPFDFRSSRPVAERVRDAGDEQIVIGKGYDHNWVIDRQVADEPRLLARVEEPGSGRVLDVLSNQPGVQFYSGNFLDGSVKGKSGRLYRQGDAVVLEPQMFPDTPNHPEFGSLRLEPGEEYRNIILFRFSAA